MAPGTASAADFNASPSTFNITIPANGASATGSFTLTPTDDGFDEDGETIAISGTTTATRENGPEVLTVTSAEVTVVDNDTRGVTISEESVTAAENGQATYTVALGSAPVGGSVTVTPSVSSGSDLMVSPTVLTFTDQDWNTPQTVTVSAGDDADSRNDEATVSHSVAGADYGSVQAAAVEVLVRDDDSQGVTVSDHRLTVIEGSEATYTLRLDAQPTGTVTVRPAVSGDSDVTVSPTSISFTASDWQTPKTVTVRAREDDDSLDDNAEVTHTVSGAAGLAAQSVTVTVTDNDQDSTGIVLTASPPTVGEQRGGQTVTVTATLDGAPLGTDAPLALQIRGDSADVTDFAAVPSALNLTIQAGQRSASGTFRLTPDNDDVDEEDETVTISATGTPALPVTEARVTITDDDMRGLSLSRQSVSVTEEGEARYTAKLASQPTGVVTVTLSVADNPDVTVFPTVLHFSSGDWNTAQGVIVRAADDPDGDGDTATVTHSFSGADYVGDDAVTLPVSVTDNDRASRAVQLSLSLERVDEDGGAASVTVRAALDGAARVEDTEIQVSVTGGAATPGTDFQTTVPNPIPVTIRANETSGQAGFTFTPVNDALDEGVGETVIFGGTAPAGLSVRTATLTIADDDGKGIVLSPGPVTLEEGGTGTYTVALNTEPTGRRDGSRQRLRQ